MLSSFKAEAKQEVAIDAARDPSSAFSAQDAQRVIVNESKKAGAPAFQFDPHATPAEKAAQAKAVNSLQSRHFNADTDMVAGNNSTAHESRKRCRSQI